MKTLLLSSALAALALGTLPLHADGFGSGSRVAGASALAGFSLDGDHFDRRGRGRGGDDRHPDDRRGTRDDSTRGGGGHGGRPRIPGGSGCDDPQDVIEHPECRL